MDREGGGGVTGFLTLRHLPRSVLEALLDSAEVYVKQLASPDRQGTELSGRTVTTVFFEPSTRTRLSFEKAAGHLGAEVMTFTPETSSMTKGESFKDTVLTLAAMGSDLLVVRHGSADAPDRAARWTGLPVVNAGAGRSGHPSQTLLDALTMRQHFGNLDGLRVGIVGDIQNSRVARSHLWGLTTLGVDLMLIGPRTLLPSQNPWGIRMLTGLDSVLGELDVVYLLRVQNERGAAMSFPSTAGYSARYGMNEERLSRLSPDAVIMHPGPINRGVEISDIAADGPRSLILRQVANGVPVRMAILASLAEEIR